MSTILQRFASWLRVARRDPALVWLVVRCYVLLIVMRCVITLCSLRRITSGLGEAQSETPTDLLGDDEMRHARRIGWSIRKVSRFTPTTSNCYPQALTARYLLHRRRIPSTVYYGAAFAPTGEQLDTHVWVRVGPLVVTGAPAHRRFAVVSAFADFRAAEPSVHSLSP